MKTNTNFRLLLLLLLLTALPSAAGTVFAQGFLHLHEPGQDITIVPDERVSGIAIRPVPPRPGPQPLRPAELLNLEVRVEIDGQVAITTLDQTFLNPNARRVEGTYLFPLPQNAAVKNLSLYIDGKPVQCEVLEADKARQIYEDIVRRAKDPALLEYVGRDLVKLRIFPIEPRQSRQVKFKYSQVLRRDFGLTEYRYPLATTQQAAHAIGKFTLSGSIRSELPLTTIYSPTHEMEFLPKEDQSIRFGFEEQNHHPSRDLKIFFAASGDDMGTGLVTYRNPDGRGQDEKGYFLLMLAPRRDTKTRNIFPKDVTFVFDTSGSMAGDKIRQARAALKYCLNSLRRKDRFSIIRFSTETELFADGLLKATEENVRAANRFVDGFEATGGTAIDEALGRALGMQHGKGGRPHIIVFLTDGKPTTGETRVEQIVRNVGERNSNGARVFSFGVGYDLNTRLLDQVSGDNGGVSDYVVPEEDIEVKVSNFFQRVASPVLTDVTVAYEGVRISDIYPKQLPDLFAGSQVTIIGRYSGSGRASVLLRGNVFAGTADGSPDGEFGMKEQVNEYEVRFPEESRSADFLPRLWAIRRVGHLVDEIRKNGEHPELKNEIIRLGKKFAIATPYTSLLVVEDESDRIPPPFVSGGPVPRRPQDTISSGVVRQPQSTRGSGQLEETQTLNLGERGATRADGFGGTGTARDSSGVANGRPMQRMDNEKAAALPGSAARAEATLQPKAQISAVTGEQAVSMARKTREMKETSSLKKEGEEIAGKVKRVGETTFYLLKGVWTDSEYDGKAKTIDIEYGLEAYFKLLGKGADVGKFLALGERVIFRIDGKWHRITSKD